MNQTFFRYASPTFQSLCHFVTPRCRRYQEGKSFTIRIAIKCKIQRNGNDATRGVIVVKPRHQHTITVNILEYFNEKFSDEIYHVISLTFVYDKLINQIILQ